MDISEYLKKLAHYAKKESAPQVEVTEDVLSRIREPVFQKNHLLRFFIAASGTAAAIGGFFIALDILSISELLTDIWIIQDPLAILSVLFGVLI